MAEGTVVKPEPPKEPVKQAPKPVPKPKPKPQPKAQTLPPSDLDGLFKKYFGTHWQTAKAIARCESGLNPSRINNNPRTGDYSVGLFQINLFGRLRLHRPGEEWLLNAENNMQYAAQMSGGGVNWRPWTCARKIGIR